MELERTEYVKVGTQHALLRRVVEAAEIDTVVDTRLVVDSAHHHAGKAHENNVIGTMNILAACSGAGSPVRKVVFKSSAHFYGCEQDDPAFFDESMGRSHRPRTSIERDVVEAEASIGRLRREEPRRGRDGAALRERARPERAHLAHRALLAAGRADDPGLRPALPVRPRGRRGARARARREPRGVPGVFNVAGDGVLALSEVAGLLGKPYAPILPPWGTGLAAAALRRVGVRIPPEAMNQLRFGRGLDNRRYKVAGFHYQHTSRETVLKLGRAPAAQPGGARGARALPLRARGRGVPALEPARAQRPRREGAGAHRGPSSWSSSASLEAELEATRRRAARGRRREARAAAAPSAPAEALEQRARARARAARGAGAGAPAAPGAPVEHYDDLAAEEVIALLGLARGATTWRRCASTSAITPGAAGCWPRSTRSWPAPAPATRRASTAAAAIRTACRGP